MQCPRCQNHNRRGARYCAQCATPLVEKVACRQCGRANSFRQAYCDHCGASLALLPPPISTSAPGERRHLTVMFCDLVGSTPLGERLDPEELHDVIRTYQEAAARAIERYDGYIARYLGDGLLVYFGYPNAHEDDAERAAHAGLEIIAELDRANTRIESMVGTRLSVRIGIHSGPTVVGSTGGKDDRETQVLGHTMNLAARLQSASKPDTVTVSAATARLLQRAFVIEGVGSLSLTGIAEPVSAFRVLERRGSADRLDEPDATNGTAFVGRERELALLKDRWQDVKVGRGRVQLVSGEPGIGKSRLVQVFGQQLAEEQAIWLACRCSPYLRNSAFAPVVRLLIQGLEFGRDDLPEQKTEKLVRAIERLDLSLAEVMPVFLTLLSLPPSERYPMIAITPEAQRKKTLAALLAWLVALSQTRPVTLVVEDLHWIDPSTLELLGLLLEAVATSRVMLVLTFRPEFEVPWLPHPHVDHITLRPLTEHEMAEVVASVADGKTLPPRLLAQVVARTDGVPLFAEELTKNLIESGYTWNEGAGDLAIPSTLQDSLMARLDRLGSAKEVAQIGAVLGRRFSHELLEIVSGMPSARLSQAIDKLVAAELLFQRGLAPAATYAFKHVLIQDTAYQSLLKATRREYHGRIAEVLATRFGEIEAQQPELIADHYSRAGNNERALQYWTKAAQLARGRAAHMEALGHLSRAMELLTAMPETPARTERELGLLVLRGGSISATRGLADPEVEGIYASALHLSEQLTDKFQILVGLWSFYLLRADLRKAHELAEQLVEIAERERIHRVLMMGHRALGTTRFYMGRPEEGHRHLLEARSYDDPADATESLRLYGQDAGATCSVYAGMVSWILGYTDDAARFSLAAVETARRAGHPYSLAVALVLASCQFQFRRDVRTARTLAEECVTLSNERGFALWAALGNIVRGWAIAYDGDPVQGIGAMRATLDSYVRTGATLGLPYFQSLLADATIPFQPDGDAHRTLENALARIDATGEYWIAPEVHRLQGELHVRDGKLTEADACFSRALEIARAQGARAWELRTVESLGRLRGSALSYAAPASHDSCDTVGRRPRTATSTIHTAYSASDRRSRDRRATSG